MKRRFDLMRIKADLVLYHVGTEYVVVDMNTKDIDLAQLYAMNEASASLWNAFQGQEFTAEMMAARLCETYEVEHEIALRDVKEMLATWQAYGIIE